MRIFITGANGFIGTHLVERALEESDIEIRATDIRDDALAGLAPRERIEFERADIFRDDATIERLVEWSDVVIPLAGVARPAFYISHPLETFELDFEANLKIVRLCTALGKRIIFPSTSEVYGKCGDGALSEDDSDLVTGPIRETRWIYSTGKQMMDRVISAYGQERGLRYSLFRPFNWTGPRLDTFADAERREARAITQMIYDVIHRGRIALVGGGTQRRSFTWIGDGIEALIHIVKNVGGRADGEIFNIGAPENNMTIRELAEAVIDEMRASPAFAERASAARLEIVEPARYYGATYADTKDRVPSVAKMAEKFGWRPLVGGREIVRRTVAYYADLAQA